MAKSQLDPFDIPANFIHGIGAVAQRFSIAEMMLEVIIHGLANIADERGQAITTHMTTPLRLSVMRSLADLALVDKPALIKEANGLALLFQDISAQRARIVHAVWFYDDSDGAVLTGTATARRVLRKSLDEQSIEDIQLIVDQITRLIERLTRFNLLANGWDGPFPTGKSDTDLTAYTEKCWAELLAEQNDVS